MTSRTSARSRSGRSRSGSSSRARSARSCSTGSSRRRRRPRNSRGRRARLHRAHGGAGRRRLSRRLEPLRDAGDLPVVRRGRAPLLRVDDLPRRRGGRPPRRALPAASPHRPPGCHRAAARRPPRHAGRHCLRGRAARRWHRHRAAGAATGDRRARDLDAVVLRRPSGRRGADDPVLPAAAVDAAPRTMILVSLVFLALLVIGVPVAVAVGAAASAMGILVPPCILMIVIGSVASLSVAALFTAGFLPAVVLALALMVYVWWKAGQIGIAAEPVPSAAGLARAFWHALIPLGMPVIIFGGILGGIMTPTEASVLAVLYAAIVGLFIYREIKWRDLPEIVVKSAMVTGAVGLLLGTAGLVSWFLTVQQLPDKLIRVMTIVPGSSLVFLFTTAVIFIFFGAVIEGLPAVVILLPSLLPVAKGLGIDPIHYAIVIVAAVGIGLFLPPIGVGLFIACGIADLSVDRATPAMMPFVAVLSVGLAVVILLPWITLVLPRLFGLM